MGKEITLKEIVALIPDDHKGRIKVFSSFLRELYCSTDDKNKIPAQHLDCTVTGITNTKEGLKIFIRIPNEDEEDL